MMLRSRSAAQMAGLRRGDVVSEINRETIRDESDHVKVWEKANPKEGVLFLINRGASAFYVVLKAGACSRFTLSRARLPRLLETVSQYEKTDFLERGRGGRVGRQSIPKGDNPEDYYLSGKLCYFKQ